MHYIIPAVFHTRNKQYEHRRVLVLVAAIKLLESNLNVCTRTVPNRYFGLQLHPEAHFVFTTITITSGH